MVDVLILLWTALTSLFRSRARLEAEILVLRQQINVLQRKSPKRSVFRTFDRLVLVGLYRLAPGIVDALAIVRPETMVRWYRAGFRMFWRWKSRRRGGRPSRSEWRDAYQEPLRSYSSSAGREYLSLRQISELPQGSIRMS
jgi:hypothetical protein